MLEPAVRQAFSLHASISGIDKSGRDIDAEDVGAQPGLWQSRRPVTAIPALTPSPATTSSPLSRMLAAMRVKSPFSHSAWFGFIDVSPRD
jgi:hypothetical protein